MLKLLRRASWNLVDQILSALTNVVLSFVVAREVSATSFGAFSIAFIIFGLAIGLNRAWVGEPMSIRHAALNEEEMRPVRGRARSALPSA